MEDMARRIAVLRALAQRIQDYVANLSAGDWQRQSACAAWQVRDVVAHLTGGAERQLTSLRRGRQGDAAPPAGFAPLDIDAGAASNARRDIARREQLGDQLLPAFAARYGELLQFMEELGPADWDKPCWHARRGTLTAREYAELRLQELAVHDWDIRWAFEPGIRLAPESIRFLLGAAPAWLGMCFRAGAPLPAPVVFRFRVTNWTDYSNDVTVQGNRFHTGPMGQERPGVTVRANANDYLLYLYGRLDRAPAERDHRLVVTGDASLLPHFEAWFKAT